MARRHPTQETADAAIIATFPTATDDPMNAWFAEGTAVQPWWIEHLEESERAIRRLRLQLQASLDADPRRCGHCELPIAGRSDRKFCSDRCRVAAHRRQRATGGRP